MNGETLTPNEGLTEVQKAVDLAWQVEGLPALLREQGDAELAQKVENAIMTVFTLDKEDNISAKATVDFLEEVIEASDGYDSGKRKYAAQPSEE